MPAIPLSDVENRITQDEMIRLFGESMPIEAAKLLFEAPPTATVGEIRAKLRSMGASRKVRSAVHQAVYVSLKNEARLLDHIDGTVDAVMQALALLGVELGVPPIDVERGKGLIAEISGYIGRISWAVGDADKITGINIRLAALLDVLDGRP